MSLSNFFKKANDKIKNAFHFFSNKITQTFHAIKNSCATFGSKLFSSVSNFWHKKITPLFVSAQQRKKHAQAENCAKEIVNSIIDKQFDIIDEKKKAQQQTSKAILDGLLLGFDDQKFNEDLKQKEVKLAPHARSAFAARENQTKDVFADLPEKSQEKSEVIMQAEPANDAQAVSEDDDDNDEYFDCSDGSEEENVTQSPKQPRNQNELQFSQQNGLFAKLADMKPVDLDECPLNFKKAI